LSQSCMARRIAVLPAVDAPLADDFRRLAELFSPDAVQLFYSIALHCRPELALAPGEYAGFVMACLRMLAFAGEPQELVAMPSPGQMSSTASPGPARRAEPALVSEQSALSAEAAASPAGGVPPSGMPPSGLAAARAAAAALQRGGARKPAGDSRVPAPQAQKPASAPSARPPSAGLAATRPVATSVAV